MIARRTFRFMVGILILPVTASGQNTSPDLRPQTTGNPQLSVGDVRCWPGAAVLRQGQDWSWLRSVPTFGCDPASRLRFIPLDTAGSIFATSAFEGRSGFAEAPWMPVVGLRLGLSSGDGDPDDDRLHSFRAPFPPGRFFDEAPPLGSGNLAGPRPI